LSLETLIMKVRKEKSIKKSG